jgi:hypothetical protein
MPSYGYMVYQAERAKSPAEQREADAQLGRLFAALAQWRHSLAKPAHGAGKSRTSLSAWAWPSPPRS